MPILKKPVKIYLTHIFLAIRLIINKSGKVILCHLQRLEK